MCEPRNINQVNSYLNWLIYIELFIIIKIPAPTGDSLLSAVAVTATQLHVLSTWLVGLSMICEM